MCDEYEVEEVGVLLPLSKVPTSAVITKRTGEKEYTISGSVRIYKQDGTSQIITSDEGTLFIIPCDGGNAINAMSTETIVKWVVDLDTLKFWVDDQLGEFDQ